MLLDRLLVTLAPSTQGRSEGISPLFCLDSSLDLRALGFGRGVLLNRVFHALWCSGRRSEPLGGSA